jgi:Na+/proline symporter
VTATLIVLLIYLAFQFGLGYYISRFIKSQNDYFAAGRNFPLIIVSISLFATWFGAETTIGSSGAVYADGISGARADPFGYGVCLILCGFLIAGKMWNTRYLTLSDFYLERFGVSVERVAVWILSVSSLIWAAAQLRAFAQVLSAATTFPLELTLLLAISCVIAYTLMGGLMGDMLTDVVQALVISLGLFLLLGTVYFQHSNIHEIIMSIPRERLSLIGEFETWPERIERLAIPILGSLVAQEILARLFSARSQKIAVRSCYVGAGLYMVLGMIPVFLGLIGPQLIAFEGESEQFLVLLATEYLNPVLLGLFLGAIISALLATIDSILLAVGALFSHNFIIPIFKIMGEKKKLLISRIVVLIAGVIVYILARHSEGIYDLLETASSFGTSGILVITLFGLWTGLGDQLTAFITVLAGLIFTPFAEYVLELRTPFIASIGFSVIIFILLSTFRANNKEAVEPHVVNK